MATAFPYQLTFCRPSCESRGLHVVAIVSDGFHSCQIDTWPRLGLPFPMDPRRTLSIRVLGVKDAASFARGSYEIELATTFLPLWRIAELCSSASDDGLHEIYLSLDVPCPPQVRTAAGSIDAEGEFCIEVESELLGLFERSRELARLSPKSNRICIMVQSRAKSEVAPSISKLLRAPSAATSRSPPVSITLHASGSIGDAFGNDAPRREPVYSTRWDNSATNEKINDIPRVASTEPQQSGGAFQTPGGSRAVDTSPFPQRSPEMLNSGSTVSKESKEANGENFWRSRYEDERRSHEEGRKKHIKRMQLAKAGIVKRDEMLTRLDAMFDKRTCSSCKKSAFVAWSAWLEEERIIQQFSQLSLDHQLFSKMRTETMTKLSGDLRDIENRNCIHLAQIQRFDDRRRGVLRAADDTLAVDSSSMVVHRLLVAWRHHTVGCAGIRRHCDTSFVATQRQSLIVALWTWRSHVGNRHLEDFRKQVCESEGLLPARSRSACVGKVLQALDWSIDVGRENGNAPHLLVSVLWVWLRFARRQENLRNNVLKIFWSGLHLSLALVLAVRCLVVWRAEVRTGEKHLAAARAQCLRRLAHCRARARGVGEHWIVDAELGIIRTTLFSWHFFTTRSKLQRSFEHSYREQQDWREKCDIFKRDLMNIQSNLDMERKTFEAEATWHADTLRIEESELEISRNAYQDALEDRKQLEMRQAETATLVQQLAGELARTEKETMASSAELQAAESASSLTEEEMVVREAASEEAFASGNLLIKKLQTDASKQQDRRHRDVRETKSRLRTQLIRQEDAVSRLEQGCKDDGEMWTRKIRQSELRSSKLESDMQATKKHLQSLPLRAASLESENSQLLATCESVEARVRTAEDAESKRKSELAKLRAEYGDIQAKADELERRLGRSRQ